MSNSVETELSAIKKIVNLFNLNANSNTYMVIRGCQLIITVNDLIDARCICLILGVQGGVGVIDRGHLIQNSS